MNGNELIEKIQALTEEERTFKVCVYQPHMFAGWSDLLSVTPITDYQIIELCS